MKDITRNLIFAVALVVTVAPVSAATWHVRSDGSGDAPNIQAGIDSSATGDTVLVAAGTYTGVGNYDIDFSGKAIVVTSEFGPTSTTIDCQNNGRGVVFKNGESAGSVLQGFTITNGLSANRGGAIYCESSSPEICFNVIVANHAVGHGGGIGVRLGSPNIHNNTLSENSTDGQGGAIAVQNSSTATIHQNILCFSTAGAGIACIGGGSTPVLSCNDIFGNAGGDALCGIDAGGNGSSDPQFCGVAGTGNLYLQSDSPCAPGRSICGQLVGALGVNCATVDNEAVSWGGIKTLFE